MNITINEEFKALIPPLSPEEYQQLEENIIADGCRDPLVLWHDTLIDGHNRYNICTDNAIEYKTINMQFDDIDHAKVWIIQNQFGRRNLPNYTRAKLALQLKPLLAARAKVNQVVRKGDQSGATMQKSAKLNIDTRQELAKIAGVSHDTIHKVETIEKNAAPELKQAMTEGRMSINTADKIATLEPEEQKQVVLLSDKEIVARAKEIKAKKCEANKKNKIEKELEEVKAAISTTALTPTVYNDSCLNIIDKIDDIDLLIADPPYFTDGDFTNHIAMYLKKVKKSGQAYIFAGADPKEIAAYIAINTNMILTQMLVWNYNNTGQRQPNEKYTSNYQVCFYYRGIDAPPINKPADGKEQYSCQTVNAPDARIGDRYHKWQKPLELIERLIKNSSKAGDFVFDPFAGSGTTLVCAAKLGRVSIGCDTDKDAIELCIKRGCINGEV